MRAPIITDTMRGTGLAEWETQPLAVTDPSFSAKGDGETDDTAAIQAAFDVLRPGDTIEFPNTGNDYIITAPIVCPVNDIKILGPTRENGSRLDFQSMAGADGLTLSGYGYKIHDFYILSSDASMGRGLALIRPVSSSLQNTLVNVQVSGGTDGIVIGVPQECTLINCKAAGNSNDGFVFDGTLGGGGGGVTVQCIGCWAYNNGRYGCFVKSTAGFAWINGAISGSAEWAIVFEYSDVFFIGDGVDIEGNVNGGIKVDGYSEGGRICGVLIQDIGDDKDGILLWNSKGVTVDTIVFSRMHANSYHFHIRELENCTIGPTWDIDEVDGSTIRVSVASSAGSVRWNNNISGTLTNDAVPQVIGRNTWLTGDTTAITNFGLASIGQIITVLAEHSKKITDGTSIFLRGSQDFDMVDGDSLTLLCKADYKWYEQSRTIDAAQTYTVANVTPDRDFDANTVAIAELADIVGTLIVDLRARGIVR